MREAVVELRIHGAVVRVPDNLDHRHSFLLALDPHQSDVALDVVPTDRLTESFAAYQQMRFEFARELLEARGEVDRIADDRIIEAIGAAEVSRDRLTGRDADSDINVLEARIVRVQPLQLGK